MPEPGADARGTGEHEEQEPRARERQLVRRGGDHRSGLGRGADSPAGSGSPATLLRRDALLLGCRCAATSVTGAPCGVGPGWVHARWGGRGNRGLLRWRRGGVRRSRSARGSSCPRPGSRRTRSPCSGRCRPEADRAGSWHRPSRHSPRRAACRCCSRSSRYLTVSRPRAGHKARSGCASVGPGYCRDWPLHLPRCGLRLPGVRWLIGAARDWRQHEDEADDRRDGAKT